MVIDMASTSSRALSGFHLNFTEDRASELHRCRSMMASSLQHSEMTPNQLRLILADALDGAAERLRAHLEPVTETSENPTQTNAVLPLPEITESVLNAEKVAELLGLSRGTVYEAMRTGEIPSLRVGRRLLVPTHALRAWLAACRRDTHITRLADAK